MTFQFRRFGIENGPALMLAKVLMSYDILIFAKQLMFI